MGHGTRSFVERSDGQQKADGKPFNRKPVRMSACLAAKDAGAGIIRLRREVPPDIDLDLLESASMKDFGSDLDGGRERPQGAKKASSDADLTAPRNSRVRRLSSATERAAGGPRNARHSALPKSSAGFSTLRLPEQFRRVSQWSEIPSVRQSPLPSPSRPPSLPAEPLLFTLSHRRLVHQLDVTDPSRSTHSSIRGTQPPHSQQCCAP